jgi:ribosome-binding protein aMBF1 (putative translation factor)
MKHNDVKKLLLQDPKLQREYDELKVLYDIKREIIRLRIEQGISQKELAERINTKQSAISRLENGDYNPSLEFLSKVATALGKELHISFQ